MRSYSIFTGLTLLSILTFSSCSTAKVPLTTMTVDGALQLTEFAATHDGAVLQARQSANTVCSRRKAGMAMIMKEETTYQGLMDEKLGRVAQKAGNVSKIFTQTQKASEGISSFSRDDYKTEIQFKCSDIK